MARPVRWKQNSIQDGVFPVALTSWKYFHDYVVQEMLDFSHYVWRGQSEDGWVLDSSLDRLLRKSRSVTAQAAAQHLLRFKRSIRGRRGSNPSKIEDENEWWALGQHHGLATPLLDWTESPFVALYFAFVDEKPVGQRGPRAVWAMTSGVVKKGKDMREAAAKQTPPATVPDAIDIVRPLQDENARLVAQSGLFTRSPLGVSVDQWVRRSYGGVNNSGILLKLTIPDSGREDCLRTLNKMNINHSSLFPDVYGSSLHCNRALVISKY
jgi:FRG domain